MLLLLQLSGSLQNHISYIVLGKQKLATILRAEIYFTHPCQFTEPL